MEGGVAIVPVHGLLTHGRAFGWSDETSYDSIRRSLAAAVADTAVRAVVLHINSPGGDVAGCFDLADAIYDMRGEKPIWAILDERAYSAAYALASSADRIIVPRTGGTGSIGVLAMHADLSGALDMAGVKITAIKFGARKDDGSPTRPLRGPALERAQADVDNLGELFVNLVGRGTETSPATRCAAWKPACSLVKPA